MTLYASPNNPLVFRCVYGLTVKYKNSTEDMTSPIIFNPSQKYMA